MDDQHLEHMLEDLPLSPQVKEFIAATKRVHREERDAYLRFAALLCSCRPWHAWRDPEPPQSECAVHANLLFDNGEWI